MKKLSFLVLMLLSLSAKSQFPVTRQLGQTNILYEYMGGLGVDSGFVFITSFADTTALNAGFLDNIAGLIARTGNVMWMRNNTEDAWIDFLNNASQGLTKADGVVQLGQSTATSGKVATFSTDRVIFNKNFSLGLLRTDTTSNGRYADVSFESNNSVVGGYAKMLLRAKSYVSIDLMTDSTRAFMDVASIYAQGTLVGSIGYVYRPASGIQHFYLFDMRDATQYAAIEVNGASVDEFHSDGHVVLAAIGSVKRVGIGAYGTPDQTLKVNGSGRFTDTLFLDEAESITDSTGADILFRRRSDSAVVKMSVPSLFTLIGSAIKDFIADSANTGTTEEFLYRYTTNANTLNADGDKLVAEYTINLSDVTADKVIKFYYAGTEIYSSGTLTATTGAFKFKVSIIRTSSSTARTTVEQFAGITAGAGGPEAQQSDLSTLTFSNTYAISPSVTVSGAGGGAGDATFKMGTVFFWPAANN
jgi:hypothetical protein